MTRFTASSSFSCNRVLQPSALARARRISPSAVAPQNCPKRLREQQVRFATDNSTIRMTLISSRPRAIHCLAMASRAAVLPTGSCGIRKSGAVNTVATSSSSIRAVCSLWRLSKTDRHAEQASSTICCSFSANGGATLAARRGTRTNGISLRKRRYSPCHLTTMACPGSHGKISTVQIIMIHHGQNDIQRARLEMFGVPLFVLPT